MEYSQAKIESGVPMPSKGHRVYEWDRMKVGDSFAVKTKSNARTLAMNANRSRFPRVFEARITNGKSRIWRIK